MSEAATASGWPAQLDLGYTARGARTVLTRRRQSGPLSVQRSFYPEGSVCHNYILHPPGGVVGGDSMRIDVHADSGAHCLLTTPGATKFYRSGAGRLATLSQHIRVADGAVVEWIPQPNIFFPGADASIESCIEVAAGGLFIGWDLQCFGLPANGESFNAGRVRNRTTLLVADELRLVEQLNTLADATLCAATGLRGLSVQGTILVAPCAEHQRSALEHFLQDYFSQQHWESASGGHVGITLVDEVLIVRAAACQSEPLLELFTCLWGELRRQCLNRAPCLPRIWAT